MPKPAEWIPLYWPDESASLEWLRGSPVNCLVVEGVVTGSPDELAKRTARLGIDVVSMDALESQVALVRKAKWPRVPVRGTTGGISAGPTGSPWVDSNGWLAALTRAKNPGKPVWIVANPPKDSGMVRGEAYTLAVADAAVYGARWLISLDADLRKGLASGNSEAMLTWQKIGQANRFFDYYAKLWGPYQTVANLGVLSDFAGPNEGVAGEVLNLSNRRYLPYRVLDQSATKAADLDGLKSVLFINQREPDEQTQVLLRDYIKAGGLVIAPVSLAHMAATLKPAGSFENSYDYYTLGSGRIAVARMPWTDPYQVATDAHLLMSRRHDVIRLWNAGTTNAVYTSNGKNAGAVQVINYATRSFGHPVSLYVAHPYKWANLITISAREPEAMPVTAKGEGVEVNLPPFDVYSAVQFGE